MPNLTGVNLANNSARYRRSKADFYQTPPEATQALVDFLELGSSVIIWECACGEGMISNVLKSNGYDVVSTDLYDYGYGESGIDFLIEDNVRSADWIITNPPFSSSEGFITRAIELHRSGSIPGGFAFLLKSQYWHARKRIDLFNIYPPAYVLPLTWRPDFAFGERGGAPTMECMWTVWEPAHTSTEYIPLPRPKK